MTLPRVLSVLVLANVLGGVLSCGGGSPPPPCTWQVCKPEWRDDWVPGEWATGQCVNQRRMAHHIYSQHHGSGSCPAPVHCSPETQHRTMCKYDSRSAPAAHGVDVNDKSSENIQNVSEKTFAFDQLYSVLFLFGFSVASRHQPISRRHREVLLR